MRPLLRIDSLPIMLKDLRQAESALEIVRAEVVVIGGGIAGLLLGTRLARLGMHTIILESGPETLANETDPLNAVVQSGQRYRGAEEGRFRGLGGTSARWGGALIPFLSCDMEPHTAKWPVDWPVALDELETRFADIERLFRLPAGPFAIKDEASPETQGSDFIIRSAKWPAFGRRNLAHLLRREIQGKDLEVWVNATVVRFRLGEDGRLAEVLAESDSGRTLNVKATIFIVAAGAIESTRLLLLLDAQHHHRVFRPDGQLGHYLFDHLSAAAATVHPVDRATLNETFGLRFERSGMRDLRIEPDPAYRKAQGLPGAFAHIAPQSTEDDGFSALRAVCRGLQSTSSIQWRRGAALRRDFRWLMQAVWWRFVKGRLLAPSNSVFELMLVIEQMPHVDNVISLAIDRRDRHGSPLAHIAWRTHDQDVDSFRALQFALTTYWKQSGFAALGELEPAPEEVWRGRLHEGSDIFHPGGTTRMGRDPFTGILDRDLRTFRLDNLYVVSTSAFPSGGGANPTLLLMAFALRAAEHIAARLGRLPS